MNALPRILAIAMAILLGGCRADGARAEFAATSLALDPGRPELQRVGSLIYLGGLRLSGDDLGGLSAMLIDGDLLTALSDTGRWFRFRLRHDGEMRLVGAVSAGSGILLDENGRLPSSKRAGEAESMARLKNGIVVGFEQEHRLRLYPADLSGRAKPIGAPAGIRDLPSNGGVEAMAELTDERLLLLAEEGGNSTYARGWIGEPGDWQEFQYRRTGEFKPTGATPLPSGEVAVVERRFSLIGGLAARITIIDPLAISVGSIVEPRELAVLEPPLNIDNFEAIAAARGADGRSVLYLLSDDNFSPFQATLLMAFAIE